ncbi:MAG TPA: hypothetical protein VNK73_13850 [Actinomycetota bacterium]|nr:hypothetical protein [Actinomycetota bacterium]
MAAVAASEVGGDDPTATRSRGRAEITYLTRLLDRLLTDLGPAGPDAEDLPDLRRVLYGLHEPPGSLVSGDGVDNPDRTATARRHGQRPSCVDGLATRVQRPAGWANQKVLYDAKRHAHTAQGLALSTIHGELLWCDGGWPSRASTGPPVGDRRTKDRLSDAQRAYNRCQAGLRSSIVHQGVRIFVLGPWDAWVANAGSWNTASSHSASSAARSARRAG